MSKGRHPIRRPRLNRQAEKRPERRPQRRSNMQEQLLSGFQLRKDGVVRGKIGVGYMDFRVVSDSCSRPTGRQMVQLSFLKHDRLQCGRDRVFHVSCGAVQAKCWGTAIPAASHMMVVNGGICAGHAGQVSVDQRRLVDASKRPSASRITSSRLRPRTVPDLAMWLS